MYNASYTQTGVRMYSALYTQGGVLGRRTTRGLDVLGHFVRGKAYPEIAHTMGVGTVTVRNAIYRVQSELGVQTKLGNRGVGCAYGSAGG